jgi:putative ABC transport system substrate-binding protein
MRRRDLLALFAGLTAATRTWAQTNGRLPTVGFLGFASQEGDRELLGALRKGLTEQGHVEGQTILGRVASRRR